MSQKTRAGVSLDRLGRIDDVMQRYVEETHIPGIVTIVYRKGELLHNKSFGLLGPDKNKPMQTDAIFRIYSMTKPIVCTALLMLFEQGKLQLFDPVSHFIPGFRKLKVYAGGIASKRRQTSWEGVNRALELIDPVREVTVYDLLTHTSGITYDWIEHGPVEDMYREHLVRTDKPLAEFVDDLLEMPLAFQPGSEFRYSFSHDVVGRLIEVISGQPLDRFLRENIFEPLKMVDTGYNVPKDKLDRVAAMYGARDPDDPNLKPTWKLAEEGKFGWISNPSGYFENREHKIFRGGQGLLSTAGDYLRFCLMLLNQGELDGERILGRKTVELMTTNHLPDSMLPFDINGKSFREYGYGLGVRVLVDPRQSQIPGSIGEFGWSGAALTYFWIDPVEEFIGIDMAQFMPDIFYKLNEDFRVLAYQAIVD
jgi:CubicO group peptidase (beta-lactamase class C family)